MHLAAAGLAIGHRRTGMRRNANHTGARQLAKVVVLELLRDGPGDKVARLPYSTAQRVPDRLFGNLALQRDLDGRGGGGQKGSTSRLEDEIRLQKRKQLGQKKRPQAGLA